MPATRRALTLDDPYGTPPKSTPDPAPAPATSPVDAIPAPTPSTDSTRGSGDAPELDLLVGERRQINVQIPAELWQAFQHRADELGFPLRVVVADALLAAVELDLDEHIIRVVDVNRRVRRRRSPRT